MGRSCATQPSWNRQVTFTSVAFAGKCMPSSLAFVLTVLQPNGRVIAACAGSAVQQNSDGCRSGPVRSGAHGTKNSLQHFLCLCCSGNLNGTLNLGKGYQMVANEDPLKHRSENMRCETCVWFAAKASKQHPLQNAPAIGKPVIKGRCRRHAPTINGYPVVFVNDWCDNHKLSENSF